MTETPPSRLKRFRLALALMMDESDVDQLVVTRDHMDTVKGGVRIDYDAATEQFTITRFTDSPNPPSRNGWPSRKDRNAER